MARAMHLLFGEHPRFEGVPRINIYLLRLVYGLMFFVLGYTVWPHILTQPGPWEPSDAMNWSVWAAFATVAGIGIFHPVKMIPLLLVEIFYKLLWLGLVAYPLWVSGELAESEAAGMVAPFVWVILPIVAVPWGFVLRKATTIFDHGKPRIA